MNTKLIALIAVFLILFLLSPIVFEYRSKDFEIDDRPEYVKEEEFIGNYIANNNPNKDNTTE